MITEVYISHVILSIISRDSDLIISCLSSFWWIILEGLLESKANIIEWWTYLWDASARVNLNKQNKCLDKKILIYSVIPLK